MSGIVILALLLQFLIKKINGALPGKFCSGFVITRRGIVVKAVVYIVIYISGVFFVIGFSNIGAFMITPN